MIAVWFIAAVIVTVWLMLVVSGSASILLSRRSPGTRSATRLILAVVPLGIGLALANWTVQFTLNESHFKMNRIFAFPALVGIVALVFWVQARQKMRNAAR